MSNIRPIRQDTTKVVVNSVRTTKNGATAQWNMLSPLKYLTPSVTSALLWLYIILSLLLNGAMEPLVKRGFFCNDSSINYPYKSDTVPFRTLMIIALVIPLVVIRLCDRKYLNLLRSSPSYDARLLMMTARSTSQSQRQILRQCRRRRKFSNECIIASNKQAVDSEQDEFVNPSSPDPLKRRKFIINEHDLDREQLPPVVVVDNSDENSSKSGDESEVELFSRVPLDSDKDDSSTDSYNIMITKETTRDALKKFTEVQLFLFGIATNILLTGIGKITCGRLRPHFLRRCKPDVDCSIASNTNRYIQDYQCTSQELGTRGFTYITTSWPSGHASTVFYSMLYLSIYLNTVIPTIIRLRNRHNPRPFFTPIVMYMIYMCMMALAGYIALTRVSDYHHHPTDVMSGSILGMITAIGTTKILSVPKRHSFI